MRLLLVSQDFPPRVGGIQTYSVELARRFAERCDDFAVLAPRSAGAVEHDRALGFRVHRVAGSPSALPLTMRPRLPRLLRGPGFDATLHAQWQTAGPALRARAAGRVRCVFAAAHGRELLLEPWAAVPPVHHQFARARRRACTSVDRWFSVSRYTAGLLADSGVRADRVEVLPNGVDAERFAPGPDAEVRRRLGLGDRPVLLTMARLHPRKGVDLVLRALPRVLAAVPDLLYLVGGDGPERDGLERLASAFGLAASVRFLGRVPFDQAPAYFRACDVFVMTPRTSPPDVEGFGLVYLEANAVAKPVVAGRTGGVPDAVVDGETGLLVDEGDVDGIADALIRLLTDHDLARRLGRQGRARVQAAYTWDHVADRMLRTMQSMLNRAATVA